MPTIVSKPTRECSFRGSVHVGQEAGKRRGGEDGACPACPRAAARLSSAPGRSCKFLTFPFAPELCSRATPYPSPLGPRAGLGGTSLWPAREG